MAALTPGISSRMLATIQAVAPIAAGIGSGIVKPGDINLADGENTFMKEAMVEICRGAISKNLTADVWLSVVWQCPFPLLVGEFAGCGRLLNRYAICG